MPTSPRPSPRGEEGDSSPQEAAAVVVARVRQLINTGAIKLLPYAVQLVASGAAYGLGITATQVRRETAVAAARPRNN